VGGRIVVAIDGPAGAGKSTLARAVASRLGFLYIDSGAMYRAVALAARSRGVPLDDPGRLEELVQSVDIALDASRVLLDGEDVTEAIRAPEVSTAASLVSAVPGVRRAMVEQQRAMAARESVVMEGRDIGTVVFPDADIKIYLDADSSVRAGRRLRELEQKGETAAPEEVTRQIRERDERDAGRAVSPLLQAPDAVCLDSTRLGIEEVERIILELVRQRISQSKDPHR